MQPIIGVTKDDGNRKPMIFQLYNLTKGPLIGRFTTKA